MNPASCTPEGTPNECPICRQAVCIEHSSFPTDDAPCPHCGHLLWFEESAELTSEPQRCRATFDEKVNRLFAGQYMAKGQAAATRKDWSRAAKWFALAVRMVPEELSYRQSLRESQRKKYRNNKTGSMLAFLKYRGIRGRIRKAREAEDWVLLDRLAEKGLAANPWNARLNAELGEAAFHRGFLDVAAFAYQQATSSTGDPAQKAYLVRLAEIHGRRNDDQAVLRTLNRIMALDPRNDVIRFKKRGIEGAMSIREKG